MLLIWRGWGLLAVVSLFPLLASCAGLFQTESAPLIGSALVASLLFAGVVCVHYGTRWNRDGTEHSFYFVPLQAWGWVYLGALGLFAALGTAAGVFRIFRPLRDPPNPNGPAPWQTAVFCGLVLLTVAATAWWLVRSARRPVGPRPIASRAAPNPFDE